SSGRRHTRLQGDWSSDVCSADLCLPEHPMTATAEASLTDADATLAAWRAREAEVRAHDVPVGLGRPEQFAGKTGLQIFQSILAEIGRASCREGAQLPVGGGAECC